ncbi:CHAT domain-containing protein [Gelidibacter salicanalis]|uniref:CHAT domain-containing protein n=1 Tax=Gelidibacter salicanalis TaxID=291193 RepID=A0A5C7AGH6_9FLAO|nr:CHAT domain-containing protein [Gelidibacter salicanalis]TXE07830.1 CHAT domain-containing protein [Gelidibacter salicanalis]
MSKKAKIVGVKREVEGIDYIVPKTLNQKFELKYYIEVSATRSQNQINLVNFDEHDIVALQFTDDTEWIGHPEDVQAIYDKDVRTKRSLSNGDYIFDIQITSEDASRGFLKRAVVKVFSVFKPKEVAKIGIRELADAYDKRVQSHPGLYQIDSKFNRIEYSKNFSNSKPFLLLLHGTLSTTVDAFNKLYDHNDAWDKIIDIYDDRILALEHYTLSLNPLQNALDFLNDCPKGCSIDIISHSRGGLIADILAKCDHRNTIVGFSSTEIGILSSDENEEKNLQLLNLINEIARIKRITINKVVRVASPASGTTILSRRVDHFFNLFLNAVVLAFGAGNPIYHSVKAFLLELVSQKENPLVLPGLNAMMPESLFQKMMNSSETTVVSDLYNIAGDADAGGLNFSSLKVILANLFYQSENDLVVDTKRMEHGVKRRDGIYKFLAKGSTINHFNYFSADNSSLAIVEALKANETTPSTLFVKHVYAEGERGILLEPLSMVGFKKTPKSISKDIVIIVPGIMGSTLANNNEEQWVNMPELNRGAIVNKLSINEEKVTASGIIKNYYYDLADHLSEKYDVLTFQFDWRKSVHEAGAQLKTQLEDYLKNNSTKIHIIAHSMGGLVVRQCMIDYPETWSKFKENVQNKFIMLGTPWLGSYLIMEVLTGHSKRVKQLAFIDFKHSRRKLLEVFWNYPGVFELMPIEPDAVNRAFWAQSFWDSVKNKANLEDLPDPKENEKPLQDFKAYRDAVMKFLDKDLNNDDFRNIYYICGQSEQTVFDYTFKNRFLSKSEKLVYKATSFGDGSVTWKSGIPKQLLNSPNLYYTHTSHGDLANEVYIFNGITDILETGHTNRLSTQQPASRSGEVISEVFEAPEPLYDSKAVVDAIFGIHKNIEPEAELFNVKVIHGDLKMSAYPVMVGHFFTDLILSSEKALDNYLDNRLSQRFSIGNYPGKIGESEVFFNLKTQPKGAIVCGLGDTDALTPYVLSKTVRQAVLKYAMFIRDNYTLPEAKGYATGISFVLMGTGYGKLPIEDSIKGILLGVAMANKQIKAMGEGLKPIKDLEMVNYYESIASETYFSLTRLFKTDNRIAFTYTKGILRRPGAKKKNTFESYANNWWFNLHIGSVKLINGSASEQENISGFTYYASNGLARVEQEMVGIGLNKIDHLLGEMSTSSRWDERLSKALFEMLIPNDFKNTFRNQNNLILKLDKYAAQIPWELLHDCRTTEIPASVTSSFIRQLISEESTRFNQLGFYNKDVLVVGDPIYNQEGLSQLPAAKVEAEMVAGKLLKEGYNVNVLINSNAKSIMMELFSKHYMIMHFAGHGIYDPKNNNIGIAIGSDICIDPAMINQMGYVPKFVFINCCFSGVVNAKDDIYSQNRYRLAANIGTQLIEMGVKAIVIAGWAVDDAAAMAFSQTFYERMLQGYDFGSAVQAARFKCYQQFQHTNTWGAYQCYGNQFYKFSDRQEKDEDHQEYVVASQVHTDLDNLLISIRDKKEDEKSAFTKLDAYIDKAEASNLLDAMVLEKEALIYDEMGHVDMAYQKYKGLFKFDNGNYSIKALEQYCSIQAYRLEGLIATALLSAKPTAVALTISEYLTEISLLTLAGRNASRLNIVGNAYKLSAKYLDQKKEIEHLKIAYKYYNEAMETATDKYSGQYLDALSNMLFIGHILETLGSVKLIKRLKTNKLFDKVTDLPKFLTAYLQELDDFDKADLDMSVLIGMTEISYAILLISNNSKANQEQAILGWYKEIYQQIYSPRYVKIEILQIDFLLNYAKEKHIVTVLNSIKAELQNILTH